MLHAPKCCVPAVDGHHWSRGCRTSGAVERIGSALESRCLVRWLLRMRVLQGCRLPDRTQAAALEPRFSYFRRPWHTYHGLYQHSPNDTSIAGRRVRKQDQKSREPVQPKVPSCRQVCKPKSR